MIPEPLDSAATLLVREAIRKAVDARLRWQLDPTDYDTRLDAAADAAIAVLNEGCHELETQTDAHGLLGFCTCGQWGYASPDETALHDAFADHRRSTS